VNSRCTSLQQVYPVRKKRGRRPLPLPVKFTQELRLSMPIGTHLEWMFGAFYDHESSPGTGTMVSTDPTTGQVAGELGHFSYPSTFSEYAAFTDFTDRFDVQLGARESHNQQSYSEYDTGPYVPLFESSASPFVYPEVHTQDSSFTYLVTPQFKISPDLMVYARVASGYRPGGPNIQSNNALVSRDYKPDTTVNYDLGLKGDFLEHRVVVDASAYYIKWKDIQLQLVNPVTGLFYYSNGSEAKSQGLELSTQARPLTGLSISAWIAWNDAKLTEPMPAGSSVFGGVGDRLPYSEPFSGSVSVEQAFPLTVVSHDTTGFVGGSVSYVGNRQGTFPSVYAFTPGRQDLPAYAKVDLQAGVDYASWRVNLYVNNVTDKRGVLDGGADLVPANAFIYIQPRTIGLSVSKVFGTLP
jgi:iron complex outermembrane recepter protein